MIVPAGNNKLDWSPKATKLHKSASDGQDVQDIEVDALYEAAKKVMASEDEKCEKCEDCDCDPCECKEKKDKQEKKAEACGPEADDETIVLDVEEVTDDAEGFGGGFEEVVEEVAEEGSSQSVSEAVAEVEAKAEQAEAVVEEVVIALEQIEEAVEGVKSVCGKGGEGEEVEGVEDKDDDDDDGIPGEEVVDSEIIVEGEDEECEPCEEASMDKSASTEEFCKYAKLSPQNRKKLNDYWTNMLGYPKDFVNLMTKDYEK